MDELAKGLVIDEDAKVYRSPGSLPASSRDSDHVCYVLETLARYFLHVEIQLRLEIDTGFRVFEYAARLHASGSHALPDDIRGTMKKGTPIPVRSVVFVLTGPKDGESGVRRYCWTHPPSDSVFFEYEVRLLYKMTMAEMMELPCFHWVFLPLAADMTRETLVPHLRTLQNMIKAESDPERKQRLADIPTAMTVVAQHHGDPTLEAFVTHIFREEIMTCEWYQNALSLGEQRGIDKGIEKGIEKGRQALLNTARLILPPEVVAALAFIADIEALEAAIAAAHKAHAQ